MTETDSSGRLPLHYAAVENYANAARARLDAGESPNAGDHEGFTPLHLAAQEWSLETAKLLLDAGAQVDAVNKFGNTPLWGAVFNSRGRGDLIELLRAHGADPHRKNNHETTPLELARRIANYDVARFFADLP